MAPGGRVTIEPSGIEGHATRGSPTWNRVRYLPVTRRWTARSLPAWLALAGSACGLDVVGAAAPTSDGGADSNVSEENASDGGVLDGSAYESADAGSDADLGVDGAGLDAATDTGAGGYIVLTASPAASPPVDTDLTVEGSTDWAHWGATGGQVLRKATGAGVIGDYVMTGSGVGVHDLTFDGWPMASSWKDGPTGAKTVTQTKSHRYFVSSPDVALTITLPAASTERTAVLFLGGYRARARLELSLDDAPSKITSDEREHRTYYHAERYEVRYRGSATTKKLVARWSMMTVYEATGTIILSSIALR